MKEAAEGKNTSMNQAVKDVDEIGYHIPGLSLASGNKIVWDSNSDRFVLLDEDNEVKHKDSETVAPHSKLFKPVSSLADREDFAVYALSGYQENATEVTFTEAIGFDSGDSEITSITYNGVSTEAGDYVFVGTTPTVNLLTIDSPSASFKHGGVIREAKVKKVKDGESYHELGKGGYIEMGTGDFVAEGSANIKVLYFTNSEADYTKISGAVVNEYAASVEIKEALDLTGAVRGDITVVADSTTIKNDAIAEFNKEVNPEPEDPYANAEEDDYFAILDANGDFVRFEKQISDTDDFNNNETIVLIKDATQIFTFVSGNKTLTLDLNGHYLDLTSQNEGIGAFSGGKLIIKDSKYDSGNRGSLIVTCFDIMETLDFPGYYMAGGEVEILSGYIRILRDDFGTAEGVGISPILKGGTYNLDLSDSSTMANIASGYHYVANGNNTWSVVPD